MSDVYIKRATQERVDEVSGNNETLNPGEMVYVTDTKEFLVGNNTKPNESGVLVKDAKNVTGTIDGKNITGVNGIFEDDGKTVKKSTNADFVSVLQTTGSSTTQPMSQKAVTESLNLVNSVQILNSSSLLAYWPPGALTYSFEFNGRILNSNRIYTMFLDARYEFPSEYVRVYLSIPPIITYDGGGAGWTFSDIFTGVLVIERPMSGREWINIQGQFTETDGNTILGLDLSSTMSAFHGIDIQSLSLKMIESPKN